MMPKKNFKWLSVIAIYCLVFSGCGYRLIGTNSALPPHIKTIHIPVFENTSAQPEIHRQLTSFVLQSFISDGRLKIVKKEEADLVVDGKLSYYNLRNVAFSSQDLVSDIIIELHIDLKVIDQVKNEIFMEKELKQQWDYKSTPDLADTETARLDALDQAYIDFGNRIVSLIIDQF
ncbi:MAG: hypothetical protein F3743_11525 [Nitrospinae bacterium]|nr:hypothetical protein [Nitrospinota bacterium]MZH06006.1 hypothetical protein [Nitrospinota bacterium]MZH14358.1 hypothetical protein [Nitrospinota bacterium]